MGKTRETIVLIAFAGLSGAATGLFMALISRFIGIKSAAIEGLIFGAFLFVWIYLYTYLKKKYIG